MERYGGERSVPGTSLLWERAAAAQIMVTGPRRLCSPGVNCEAVSEKARTRSVCHVFVQPTSLFIFKDCARLIYLQRPVMTRF